MNCKPGDLAIVVKTIRDKNLGLIVRVVRPWSGERLPGQLPYVLNDGLPAWVVEGRIWADCRWEPISVYADYCLRPIRDPGEDARDETLEWLPVPTRTPETA